MNRENYEKYVVSPITKKALHIDKKSFITDDKSEKFDIVKNVPILLANEEKSEWHRELIEAILWEHPEEITEMYIPLIEKAFSTNLDIFPFALQLRLIL